MTRRLALFVLPFAALLAADQGAAQGQAGFDNDADANRALSEARQQGAAARQRAEALEADRYAELPDLTFTRALAHTVCRALKVDAEPVLAKLPGEIRVTGDDITGPGPPRNTA